ncbi:MAG: hypothetical protein IPO92_10460 [Saprospiraceae bacterium]|nr:hypothetical protein [Saprospiraceae bacterium]
MINLNANTIYILTGTGDNSATSFVTLHEYAQPSIGVMKSTDGGINWTLQALPSTPNTNYIGYDLVQNPVFGSELLAATSDGVFLTLNGGSTWTKVKKWQPFRCKVKPNDSDICYCSDANNFYRSIDFGQTWTASTLTPTVTGNNRIAMGVTSLNTSEVYLLCGSANGVGAFKGVYKSTDSGLNFTRQATTPNILGYETNGQDDDSQGGYDLCIAASPTVSNRVVYGINIWTTTNRSTITNQTKWYENYSDPNAFYTS